MEKVRYAEDEDNLEVQETIKETPRIVNKSNTAEVVKINETKKVTEILTEQNEAEQDFEYKSKENPILCNLLRAESKATILSKMKQVVLEQSLKNKLEELVHVSEEKRLKIKELQSEKENLQKQLIKEQSQRPEIFKEMENTGLMVMMLKEHTEYVRNQYDLHKEKKNNLEINIKNQTEEFEAFKSSVTDRRNKNKETIRQLKENKSNIDLLLSSQITENQLTEMENQVKHLKKSYDSSVQEKNEKIRNVELYKDKLENIEKSRKQLELTLKNLNMQTEELVLKYKINKADHEKNIQDMEVKIEDVKNRASKIKQQNEHTQYLLDDGIKLTIELESKCVSSRAELKQKEKENENLVQLSKDIKEQFLNKMNEHHSKQKNLNDSLENIDHNIVAVIQDNTDLMKNMQESLENKHNILIQSTKLKLRKEHLESEASEKEKNLSNLQQKNTNLKENVRKLQTALEDITEKLSGAENIRDVSKTEHKCKIDEAKRKCSSNEEQFKEKIYLLKQQKIQNEKIIPETRETNSTKLTQMKNCVENLNLTIAQENRRKEELGIKSRAKKDLLCKLVTKKRKLTKEAELLKNKYKNSVQNPVAENTTAASILKSPGKTRTPNKRVSFQQNLVWDSSSDGSSDAILSELLCRPKLSEQIQQVSKSSEELFDEMLQKSPPEKLI